MLKDPRWAPGVRAELLDGAALESIGPAWEDLCSRAAEDNVYYSPRYAQALLRTVEIDRKIRFAVAWDGPELIGFLPFSGPELCLPYFRKLGQAWKSRYTFSCMPLVDAARSDHAASALLDALSSVNSGEWLIPVVNVRGEACRAFINSLERRGLPWVFMSPFQRASLSATCNFDEHMQNLVPVKRRKGLARCRRRLEELGTVEHQVHRSGEGLAKAVAAFLDLESRGWKGKRGTAMACEKRSLGFALDAFTGDERRSICRADVLSLNFAPIAVSLAVFAGKTGFAVKTTYDEAYRSYGAGLLLEIEIIRSFLSERWANRLDAATAGEHVIDSLWPDRVEVADLAFSLHPQSAGRRLAVFATLETWRRALKARARRVVRGNALLSISPTRPAAKPLEHGRVIASD